MKTQSITWFDDTIVIDYANGRQFRGNCLELPTAVFEACAAARHGIAQKLGDAKSGGTASEKFEEVVLIWTGLMAGEWNRRGGGSEDLMPVVFERLAVQAKQAPEKAAEWLEAYRAMSEDERAEARNKKAIKAMLALIKAERKAAPDGDGDFDPLA